MPVRYEDGDVVFRDNAEIVHDLLVDENFSCSSDSNFLGSLAIGLIAPTTAAQVEVVLQTLGDVIQRLRTIATNDDVIEDVTQNRVATTNATVTTLHTFTIPPSNTYMIIAQVVARRTGGSAGTAEDGAGYQLQGVYKNVAGVATLIGNNAPGLTTVYGESQTAWDATMDVTGATARVRVTGAVNNNITWHMTARMYALST